MLGVINNSLAAAGNRNQRTRYDYAAAAVTWNEKCMQELEKPADPRRKMFPKTVPLIENFHTKWLQHENQKKTLRQTVPLDTGDGVVQSVVAQHSVRDLRKQLQDESTGVRPPVLGAPIQSRKRVRNDNDNDNTNNTNNDTTRLTLPPAEVSQATRNPGVMEIVARGESLVLSATSVGAAAAPSNTNKVRCLRCGNEKVGDLHPGDGAANKLEYCKVPENERHEGWIVPNGFQIGDTREKTDSRAVRGAWKRQKKELDIEDEQQFDGW
jgi:hypothetical protein